MNYPKYCQVIDFLKQKNYRGHGYTFVSEDEKTIAIVTHGGKVVYHPIADI